MKGFRLRILLTILLGLLLFSTSVEARRLLFVSERNTDNIVRDLASEFNLKVSELMPLVKNLEAISNKEDFYYYLERIRKLSKNDRYTLIEFLKCLSTLKDREKADLVFALIESMHRLRASSYCLNSVLKDICDLPTELKDIKQGFETLLGMLIEITRIDPKEKDVQPDAYDFLRRFKEEVIAENWIKYPYLRNNFVFVITKVTQIMTERGERFSWDAFSQINIFLNRAGGDLKETERLIKEYYAEIK
ncbi:MAG: hypothetical protein NC818_05635 [Candidatus Omnitrophica bacterium]|nr:hypothetical protein [Candidatus Omnitrophota bacterium]